MRAALDTNLLVYAEGLGELSRVLTGKAGHSADQARDAVLGAWRGAMDLCVAHQLASWDALLLTEDLHAGFCWRGVRVVNPLVEPTDPLLLQLLG